MTIFLLAAAGGAVIGAVAELWSHRTRTTITDEALAHAIWSWDDTDGLTVD